MPTCVVVSGFAAPGFEWRWSPLTHMLWNGGWDVRIFRSGLGHPGERAERIADKLVRVDGPIFAVGHSMGGVVCEALDVLTGRIDSVVTLGSPLGGVPLLRLLPVAFGGLQQIRERSAFLSRMEDSYHAAKYLCIAGSHDALVSRTSAWAIARAKTVLVPAGHVELCVRKDVANIVGEFFGITDERKEEEVA